MDITLKHGSNGSKVKRGLKTRLKDELERIRVKLGLNHELGVAWTPDVHNELSGEVREGVIYIYEVEEDKVQALRHEFLDHLITSRLVKPLVNLVNLLIKSREAALFLFRNVH